MKLDSVFDAILHGEFPINTKAKNRNAEVISNHNKMKLVSVNKNKIINEKVLVLNSVHNSEDSLRKVSKILIKIREFNCSTGYLVFFYVI